METSPIPAASIVAMLQRNPVVQKLKERYDFTATATVETGAGVDLQEARAWAIRDDDASFRYLEGRALSSPIFGEERVLWKFEFEEDAILFACRFGGIIRGPISVSDWRRHNSGCCGRLVCEGQRHTSPL